MALFHTWQFQSPSWGKSGKRFPQNSLAVTISETWMWVKGSVWQKSWKADSTVQWSRLQRRVDSYTKKSSRFCNAAFCPHCPRHFLATSIRHYPQLAPRHSAALAKHFLAGICPHCSPKIFPWHCHQLFPRHSFGTGTCPLRVLWGRWAVPMEAFPFHLHSQHAPQICVAGGWMCRWLSRARNPATHHCAAG